ncbi:MAG: CoA-binding protein [Bacteroidetes bacterium]|nr:CoA-binding protein [Bacteroidota bacterium]
MKTTVVIGASENRERYSNRAVRKLREHNHNVIAIGLKQGRISGIANGALGFDSVIIQTGFPKIEGVDSVSLYVGAKNQPVYYDYILSLKPRRVIFNPGAENPEFAKIIRDAGIESLEACTLVMLTTGVY